MALHRGLQRHPLPRPSPPSAPPHRTPSVRSGAVGQNAGECARWNDSDLGPKGPPFPNCSQATGLPWYDHDGFHNPLGDEMDSPQLHKMADAVEALTLSAFYTGSAAHGERAAALLRAWFLDPATRMNPNADCKCRGSSVASLKSRMARSLKGATLAVAQGIPGKCAGRGIGLIDFASEWPILLDCVVLLEWLGHWPASDAAGLRQWMVSWLDWMLGSRNGKDERAALNNHGTYYDHHAVSVAAFVGNASVAAEICAAAPKARLEVQLGPNGTLPKEDSRTKSQGCARPRHAFDCAAG